MSPGPKITIVSAWVGPRPRWLDRVEENHLRFARHYDYRYVMLGEPDFEGFSPLQTPTFADFSWLKIDAIRSALTGSDYAFWIDADSVFLEPFRPLTQLLPARESLTFTGDRNDLCNGGHLIFRNSQFSWNFLESWDSLRQLEFPPLNTTMQSADGFITDQVGLNYLLAGGVADSAFAKHNGAQLFNRVNGWRQNSDRVNKAFHLTHAPVSRSNVSRAFKLIPRPIRKNFKLVQQHLLNAYPWWGPGANSGNRPGPIVHFVGPWKELLEEFPDSAPSWR